MALVSRITPILYARYLFTITGLLMFSICYFISKENNKFIIGLICGAIMVMSISNLIENVNANYDKSNDISDTSTALELFCSLAERLDDIKHYIDHGLEEHNGVINFVHGKVYSDIF